MSNQRACVFFYYCVRLFTFFSVRPSCLGWETTGKTKTNSLQVGGKKRKLLTTRAQSVVAVIAVSLFQAVAQVQENVEAGTKKGGTLGNAGETTSKCAIYRKAALDTSFSFLSFFISFVPRVPHHSFVTQFT